MNLSPKVLHDGNKREKYDGNLVRESKMTTEAEDHWVKTFTEEPKTIVYSLWDLTPELKLPQ